ncbi:MAG: GntR family transcriptional regulator, partial [Synergistaceae bacterium]|nr:GntR family transcriptional regulator [Synergistaceae bacterium]
MLNLRPVKLLPVREQAASSLREAIITQNIKQGEILTLDATAKALGISVTPVREAFQILARDGLIELAQNR